VPQLYLTEAAGEKRMRLLGVERVELTPGESRQLKLTADPWLLARLNASAGKWSIVKGTYWAALEKFAKDLELKAEIPLAARLFGN